MSSIAVLGDKDTVTGFKLGGIKEGRAVESSEEARSNIKNLIDEGYSIILITEKIALENRIFIESLTKDSALPMIIEIPDKTGSLGGGDPMNDLIKRVIGVDMVK